MVSFKVNTGGQISILPEHEYRKFNIPLAVTFVPEQTIIVNVCWTHFWIKF